MWSGRRVGPETRTMGETGGVGRKWPGKMADERNMGWDGSVEGDSYM